MDNKKPKYFYLVHFFTNHDLILQKIIEAAKVFTDDDPEATITTTPINNGYTVLVVESSQPISEKVMDRFEKISDCIDGLVHLFSHSTICQEENGEDRLVPSYAYSSYYHLYFNPFSRYLGSGRLFINRLVKKLLAITGGVYELKLFKNEMVIILESDTPFVQSEIDDLLRYLSHPKIKLQSSFRNF